MGDNRSTTLEGMRVDNISDNLYRDKVILAPMVRAVRTQRLGILYLQYQLHVVESIAIAVNTSVCLARPYEYRVPRARRTHLGGCVDIKCSTGNLLNVHL